MKEEAEEKKSKSEQEEIELVKRLKTTTQIQQNSKLFIVAEEYDKINLMNVMQGTVTFNPNKVNNNNVSTSSSKK